MSFFKLPSFLKALFDLFFGPPSRAAYEQYVEAKFQRALRDRYPAFKALYQKRFKNVLNTDQAKEFCPEYSANPVDKMKYSKSVYRPAKEFINRLYRDELQSGKYSTVVFLAGGAGSGKSTAVESLRRKESGDFPDDWLVVDGTLSNHREAKTQIEEALRSGQRIFVVYVYCPLQKAIPWAIDRAIKLGRGLTLKRLAQTHFDSQACVLSLARDFADHPEIDFQVVDYSADRPSASVVERIESMAYSRLDEVQAASIQIYDYERTRRRAEGNPVPPHIEEIFQKTN